MTIMNITQEQFTASLEECVRETPAIFSEWDTIDEDLRAEYAEQTRWLLTARYGVLVTAIMTGRFDIVQRLVVAFAEMLGRRVELERFMGIVLQPIASTTTAGAPESRCRALAA